MPIGDRKEDERRAEPRVNRIASHRAACPSHGHQRGTASNRVTPRACFLGDSPPACASRLSLVKGTARFLPPPVCDAGAGGGPLKKDGMTGAMTRP